MLTAAIGCAFAADSKAGAVGNVEARASAAPLLRAWEGAHCSHCASSGPEQQVRIMSCELQLTSLRSRNCLLFQDDAHLPL